jgi:hypothetical protein
MMSEVESLAAGKDDVNLFRTDEKQYGEKFRDHVLEQYKLYVEMADRVSARRALANTFFLTVNTALLSFVTLYSNREFIGDTRLNAAILTAVTCGLVVFSASWWQIIKAYDQLNAGKFSVIHELERKLPAALYDKEWELLGRGADPKKYRPLTRIERVVPLAFITIYVALLIVRLLVSSGLI